MELSDVAIQVKKYYEYIHKNEYKYKYYVIKDKFEKLNKDIEIESEEVLTVEITRKGMEYSKYNLECYYLGIHERNKLEERKTQYGKMNLSGVKYKAR